MTPALAWAVVCGVTLGLGLWAILSVTPRLSRPRLVDRVAPYVLDVSPGARELIARRPADPLPVLGFVFAPIVESLRRGLGVLLGGPDATAHRLRQAGSTLTVEQFRGRQLLWATVGAGVGVLASIAAARATALPLVAQLGIVAVFAASGVALRDYSLQRAARARLARMASELPTVLEFLTLSLSAGEGILDANRRISRISQGELAAELGRAIADVNTGLPFAESLARVGRELDLPPFTRFVEQVVGALDRGTPIVEVLRAQAQDSRDDAKRQLLELAGKKEVAMLAPRCRVSPVQISGGHPSRLSNLLGGACCRGPPEPKGSPRKARQMTTNYPEKYAKFQTSIREAVTFADPNWTNSAITRERIKRVRTAREELGRAIPETDTRPQTATDGRKNLFDALRPNNADTVAVAANEWAKVEKLIDAGRDLGQIIKNADRARLASILDQFPTSQVALDTTDPEAVVGEVEDIVFARLVELGDGDARQVADTADAESYEGAWARIFTEAISGEVSVTALSALHRVAPDEFQATLGDAQDEVTVAAKLKDLDRTAESVKE